MEQDEPSEMSEQTSYRGRTVKRKVDAENSSEEETSRMLISPQASPNDEPEHKRKKLSAPTMDPTTKPSSRTITEELPHTMPSAVTEGGENPMKSRHMRKKKPARHGENVNTCTSSLYSIKYLTHE